MKVSTICEGQWKDCRLLFFSEPYIAVSVSVSGTGIDTETGTCDEILLEVCLHKLLGYIEAVNIGTCNQTYHNECATNYHIIICAFGYSQLFLRSFEHVTGRFMLT